MDLSSFEKIILIGASSGWGAKRRETEFGPSFMYEKDLTGHLAARSTLPVSWKCVPTPISFVGQHIPLGKATLAMITSHAQNVAKVTRRATHANCFPCVIGGDHSIAIGTWQGISDALDARGVFGLIWFDAHMDAHTPQTSPSQAYHGMPVATLLGYGEDALIHITDPATPTLSPEHVVLMGVRSFEAGEEALLARLGVRIYFMDEIRTRGFETCLQEAIARVQAGTKGFGLSIDLDGFDPAFAPGVGSPETGGLYPDEVVSALHHVKGAKGFCGLEIMEFNPTRDRDNITSNLIESLAFALLP